MAAIMIKPCLHAHDRLVYLVMMQAQLGSQCFHHQIHPLDILRTGSQCTGSRGGTDQALGGVGVFFKRHQIRRVSAELDAERIHPFINGTRQSKVAMHRVFDGPHAICLHTAVIAGEQHGPFGQRHKDRVMDFQFHRQFDGPATIIIACGFNIGL